MPVMFVRLSLSLLLALTVAACAPTHRSTAKSPAVAGEKPTTAPHRPMRVVMGDPLPEATAPSAPSAQPFQAPPPVQAAQPAPTGQPALAVPAPQTAQAAEAKPFAAPLDASGQPAGFGGMAWGASIASNPGLAVQEADKAAGVTTCLWPEGPRDIAGAPIRDAFYEFYQDKFYHVWIDYDGMAAYKAALAELVRTYGPPTKEVPDKYYHAWTLGQVNVYCAYHPAENGGDVSFFYQPVYEPMMAARKAAAKHAAGKKAK